MIVFIILPFCKTPETFVCKVSLMMGSVAGVVRKSRHCAGIL